MEEIPLEKRENMQTKVKGSLVGTQVNGDRLQLWYSSPTGDSSDSVITTMPCRSEEEALDLQDLHRSIWGLSEAPRETEVVSYQANDQDW